MDNIVLWIALIGVIGTLGGVYLGNWLQSRNIKQQRDWMLQDQKREWVRRQRQEKFERALEYIKGMLEGILKVELILQSGSKDLQQQELLKLKEIIASGMPILYMLREEDKKLAKMIDDFDHNLQMANRAINANEYSKLDSIGQDVTKLVGQIRQRMYQLLEETFD